MTAFSYVGILSLLWVQLLYAVFVSHLPPSSFLEGLSSEQFEGLGYFSSGLFFGLPVFRGFVLSKLQGCFDILSFLRVCSKAILSLVILLISAIERAHFSYSSQGIFLYIFYRAFLSNSVLSSTPYIGLLCLLRVHAVNSCVGDAWQRLWWDDFTHNGKQAVNRLKIPQGLSTLMFRRWSEVPSRGGVRGDSP